MNILGLCITRDSNFWARKDWLLYKYFKKRRMIPCGRTKTTSYLCCCLSPNDKNSYISEDGHEIRCKVCNSLHVLSSNPIKSITDIWDNI